MSSFNAARMFFSATPFFLKKESSFSVKMGGGKCEKSVDKRGILVYNILAKDPFNFLQIGIYELTINKEIIDEKDKRKEKSKWKEKTENILKIIFEEDNINTMDSVKSDMLLTTLSAVAQQESANISEHNDPLNKLQYIYEMEDDDVINNTEKLIEKIKNRI